MATLTLEQVTKVFDNGVQAVDGLDLDVGEGEFVVLVGPSGCGKTTVLRIVAGLEEATSGTIKLDGQVANDLTPGQRDIAMVFQNYALYPHLNVHQNIGFSLRSRKVPKQTRDEKIKEAAALLGLTELLQSKPRHLSGGQRQRVAMGRALVREPAVFLMDEPLSNLDAGLRVQMRTEVMHIQKRLGVATMYVTHDQTEAMTMGDRVAVMRSGVLQQLASPQELYDRPANVFVASFMGSPAMNLFEAVVDAGELVVGAQRLALGGAHLPRSDGKLVIGIRPEDLVPLGEGRDADCRLAAEVDLVEALGNEQLVHFAIDAANYRSTGLPVSHNVESDVATQMAGTGAGKGVARIEPRLRVRPSERITLAIDPDRLYFFDPETGQAVGREQPVAQEIRA